jgi:hypothetical protein
MTNAEIINLYDTTNITLQELANLTGYPVSYLKALLLDHA